MSDEGKLFVGGLCFDTDETSLEESFSKYGTIAKVDVVRERESGKSRGFGFVTFENPQDAKDALAAMNGKSIDGRQVRVDEAGKPGGRSTSYRGFSGGRTGGYSRGGRGRGGGGFYDRSYGDRSFSGDRSYGSRSYGSSEERSYGGGYRSSGGGYKDSRGRGGYGQRSGGTYRDSYDSYASHE